MSTLVGYLKSFGRGLAYPFRLDPSESRFAVSVDEENVRNSIKQIIGTGVGERPYLLKDGVPYGTRLRETLFSNAAALEAAAPFEVKKALDVWEPRITVLSVNTTTQDTSSGGIAVYVDILFRYRSSNRTDNLVYPFVIS